MLTNKQERFLKAKTVETGLSDFHKMVAFVFKTSFKKQKPKTATYRDCKHFDNEKFRESLVTSFSMGKNISYDAFENLILKTLGKMAPIKQKHIRGNQSPFMNKDIHMAYEYLANSGRSSIIAEHLGHLVGQNSCRFLKMTGHS